MASASPPAAAKRTRSRSVRMPIGLSPSTTTTEPTPWSRMRDVATATDSEASAVRTGRLITSATVRITAPSAIAPPACSTHRAPCRSERTCPGEPTGEHGRPGRATPFAAAAVRLGRCPTTSSGSQRSNTCAGPDARSSTRPCCSSPSRAGAMPATPPPPPSASCGDAWGARSFATLDPEHFYDFSATRPQVQFDENDEREVTSGPRTRFAVTAERARRRSRRDHADRRRAPAAVAHLLRADHRRGAPVRRAPA